MARTPISVNGTRSNSSKCWCCCGARSPDHPSSRGSRGCTFPNWSKSSSPIALDTGHPPRWPLQRRCAVQKPPSPEIAKSQDTRTSDHPAEMDQQRGSTEVGKETLDEEAGLRSRVAAPYLPSRRVFVQGGSEYILDIRPEPLYELRERRGWLTSFRPVNPRRQPFF